MSCILASYPAGTAHLAAAPGVAMVTIGQTPDPWAGVDADALYAQRADILKAKQAAEAWSHRAASGKDYESSWKLARACYFLATNGPKDEQDYQLDRGVTAGQQAAALDPKQPEGHFWYAANMGEKAQRGSMFTGLKYKGSIKSELEAVIAIKPGWQGGSAESALGQWYLKVPGMAGGDHDKGVALLRQVLVYAPDSNQGKYTLAEAIADDSKTRAEAKTLLQQVIDSKVDPDWAAEDQGFKAKARVLLDKLNKK